MSDIGVNSTYDSLLNSGCNSCEIYPDKSSYWTPNLYYARPNGSFEEVAHTGSVIYYLARGMTQDGRSDFTPYPKGFKMVSGNKAVRSYNATGMTWGNATYPSYPKSNAVTFACLSDPIGPETPNLVNASTCVGGLRAQVHFQSCWQGKDLYKSDNSHVAYLSQIDNGVCPPGYPILLPHLFIETNYGVTQTANLDDGGYFVFSQGDPTGYGFHGDFFNGWQADILKLAVENCFNDIDSFGTIVECPILEANRALEFGRNCPQQPQQVDEPARGMLDKLPGCIKITPGPQAATAADMECAAGVPQPAISHTVDSTPYPTANPPIGSQFGLPHQEYVGCGTDSVGEQIRTLNAGYMEDTNMTIEACQSFCTGQGYKYSGIEYQYQCFCDIGINPNAVISAGVNMSLGCDMTCPGNRAQLCGVSAYMTIFENTDPAFVPTTDITGSASQLTIPVSAFASNYLGCASEGHNGRALNASAYESSNMTLEICASYCADLNYPFYGLEYYTQCFCGDGLASGSAIVDTSQNPLISNCSTRCGGNFAQVCGGPNYLSIYANHKYVPVVIPSTASGMKLLGCLPDPDPVHRSMSGAYYQDQIKMTVAECANDCIAGGYAYAGYVFFSVELWVKDRD